MSTTIAAISTPSGEGGIGIVRISGDCARAVADKIFKSVSGKKLAGAAGYTALFGGVYDNDEKIDEAVALVFAAPKSYTGEDVVELSVHGGSFVTRAVLRAALEAGAENAAPGEFTRRAYQNGKMNIAEAESVMSLISARGKEELKMALSAKDGKISREIAKIKNTLLEIEAGMAVFADYPDEDLPEVNEEKIRQNLCSVRDSLSLLLKNFDAGRAVREGIKTAIIGAPNVGKSTLMNLLSGDERSIVTPVAGTTRDVIEETVRVGSVLLRLADTAGVHTAADEVEAIGVTLACRHAEQSQLVLAVFDGSQPLSEDDRRILELVADKQTIIIINKTDKPMMIEKEKLPQLPTVELSAKDGGGVTALEEKIAEITGVAQLSPDAAVLLTERQRACAFRAHSSITEAISAMDAGYTLDAVGICADEALAWLLELTGERVTDAVADEVFSRFCVGK